MKAEIMILFIMLLHNLDVYFQLNDDDDQIFNH